MEKKQSDWEVGGDGIRAGRGSSDAAALLIGRKRRRDKTAAVFGGLMDEQRRTFPPRLHLAADPPTLRFEKLKTQKTASKKFLRLCINEKNRREIYEFS